MKIPDKDPLLVAEVAVVLRKTPAGVYQDAKLRRIESFRVGGDVRGSIRIPRQALIDFIARGTRHVKESGNGRS